MVDSPAPYDPWNASTPTDEASSLGMGAIPAMPSLRQQALEDEPLLMEVTAVFRSMDETPLPPLEALAKQLDDEISMMSGTPMARSFSVSEQQETQVGVTCSLEFPAPVDWTAAASLVSQLSSLGANTGFQVSLAT